jgi:hypothetical protein
MRSLRHIFIFAPMLLLFSCNTDLKGLLELQQEVVKKVHTDDVEVNLDDNTQLTVSITNSPYCDSSDEVKQRLSEEIGLMALRHKKLTSSIKEGYTAFIRSSFYVIAYSRSSKSFSMNLHGESSKYSTN